MSEKVGTADLKKGFSYLNPETFFCITYQGKVLFATGVRLNIRRIESPDKEAALNQWTGCREEIL